MYVFLLLCSFFSKPVNGNLANVSKIHVDEPRERQSARLAAENRTLTNILVRKQFLAPRYLIPSADILILLCEPFLLNSLAADPFLRRWFCVDVHPIPPSFSLGHFLSSPALSVLRVLSLDTARCIASSPPAARDPVIISLQILSVVCVEAIRASHQYRGTGGQSACRCWVCIRPEWAGLKCALWDCDGSNWRPAVYDNSCITSPHYQLLQLD